MQDGSVPLKKQSKRKQKEYHAAQRKGWGDVNPVTKVVGSAKVYNRKKVKRRGCEHEPCLAFLFIVS
jgi:hypothetical protein